MNDIVERLRSNSSLPLCPYDSRSPEYWTTPDDQPCKFCGGLPDGTNKCTGADTRILSEAADDITQLSTLYSNAIARAEKAEEALRVAGWQKIETAPKDGTYVLLSGGYADTVWYDNRSVEAQCIVGWFEGVWRFCSFDGGAYGEYNDPTHWQPLPAPPEPKT